MIPGRQEGPLRRCLRQVPGAESGASAEGLWAWPRREVDVAWAGPKGPRHPARGCVGLPCAPQKRERGPAPAPVVLAPRCPDPCAFSAVVITGWFPEAEGVLE